ncbi:OmpA family protein [Persicirhabdus sediminis]|uniref:OmpA family protein n=1 Tax=Persicirhabdus sediminis TaxID=454144 RepID=A0A8J7SI44_9BACT|nr:OmpA family protein [Persicirhabdus sediminis]MBK1790289.1 OmpA family protein [Persicirhabdus sediminis]
MNQKGGDELANNEPEVAAEPDFSSGAELDGSDTIDQDILDELDRVMALADERGDISAVLQALGDSGLTSDQQQKVAALAKAAKLKSRLKRVAPQDGMEEVWELELENGETLQFAKVGEKYEVLPAAPASGQQPAEADGQPELAAKTGSEAVAGSFVKAVSELDVERARGFIDLSKVSYAKLVGMCILFEEGEYGLRDRMPVRKMFERETRAGYLVHLRDKAGTSAMFALSLERADASDTWKVVEVNLDKLLENYSQQYAGGDSYYTPLVVNPKGGDSVLVYFDYEEKELTPRSKRQLSVVGDILKQDRVKTLVISGHTDALGSDAYNLNLSQQRALAVKAYFVELGVPEAQIKTKSLGRMAPRAPNTKDDGSDDPIGRRANRRAEILLDFEG